MPSSIALNISGIDLTLTRFTGTELPRVPVATGQVSYTATGVATGSGVAYEPKHLWTINALLTQDEANLLSLIWREHDRLRRALQPADIWVIDFTEEFSERIPRTRVLAPGTIERLYPAINPTHAFYYPKWAAWMPEPPRYQQEGRYKAAEIMLFEAGKLMA
jgi:hypothetical protein